MEIMTNVRTLTLKDAEDSTEDFWDEIGLSDYENDEHVKEQDWIIGDITFDGVAHIIIHGFPGDNASGIIYDPVGKKYYMIGEGMTEEDCLSAPQMWYLQVTNHVMEWESPLWYNR